MMQNELPFIGWPAIALIAFLVLKGLNLIMYAFGKKAYWNEMGGNNVINNLLINN